MDAMLSGRLIGGEAARVRPVSIVDVVSSQQGRRERLITATRLFIGAVSLVALTIDPSRPERYASLAYDLVFGYTFYAILAALHAWRADAFTHWWPKTT